MKKHNIQ